MGIKILNPLPLYVQKLIDANTPIIERIRVSFSETKDVVEMQKLFYELERLVEKISSYCVGRTIPFEWRSDLQDGKKLLTEMSAAIVKRAEEEGSAMNFEDIGCSFCGAKIESGNIKCSICGTPRR